MRVTTQRFFESEFLRSLAVSLQLKEMRAFPFTLLIRATTTSACPSNRASEKFFLNPLFSFQLLAKHILVFTFPRICVCEFTTSQLSKARSSFIHCTYPVWSSNLSFPFSSNLLFSPANRQATAQSCETPSPIQNPVS